MRKGKDSDPQRLAFRPDPAGYCQHKKYRLPLNYQHDWYVEHALRMGYFAALQEHDGILRVEIWATSEGEARALALLDLALTPSNGAVLQELLRVALMACAPCGIKSAP